MCVRDMYWCRAGGDFGWGQLRQGKLREGKTSAQLKFWCGAIRSCGAWPSEAVNCNPPNPRFLVDNQLCETLVGPSFEQHQLRSATTVG